MDEKQFFTFIDSDKLCELIHCAEKSVIYVAPGLWDNTSIALTKAAVKLGREMVIVCLDVNEQTMRLGYGNIEAVQQLKVNNLLINHIEHLRFALIVVDGQGYSFTPTALYLESEQSTSLGFNAIKLTPEQIKEATARLSPAAKAIALATCTNEEQIEAIAAIEPDMANNPVADIIVEEIGTALKKVPPAEFDISRQVRVYSSYLQYVEVKMTGAAIQRQKISMPKVFQSLGEDNKALEGRLKTSFDLLAKDNELSSKALEDQIKELRDDFTPSLGKKHGRVMLKSNKALFNKELEVLKENLKKHAENVEQNLQTSIDDSVNKIGNYYLPLVIKNPPNKLRGALGMYADEEEEVLVWIIRQLKMVFPNAEQMIGKMEISVIHKDVTYENLNDHEFLVSVKKAFPDVNWDKAHQEYLAASEKESA